MDFIRDIFIPILSILIGLIIAKNNIKTPQKLKVIESQFYKVYLPIFRIIEDNLYKEIDIKTANNYSRKMLKIAYKNYELFDPELYYWIKKFSEKVNSCLSYNDEFETICIYVDGDYEKLKKALNLPKRNFAYKINNKQFKYKTRIFIDEFFSSILKVLILILGSLILSLVIRSIIKIFTFINQ